MDTLRFVKLELGYTLRVWNAGRYIGSPSKDALGYRLCKGKTVLFQGEDFGCSPLHAWDSDATLRAILDFLTLQPGDTDSEYFANYNKRQMAFAQSSDCETLQWLYSSDDSSGTFEDINEEE